MDISSDGSIIGAACLVPAGQKPYYWSQAGGWKSLALAVNFSRGAELVGMSSNGQVFAGTGYDNSNSATAIRWSSPTATSSSLTNGSNCIANDLSADGNVVLGESASSAQWYAWTGTSAPVTLMPNASMPDAKPMVVSGNGSVRWGASTGNGLVRWAGSSSTTISFVDYALEITASNQDGSVAIGAGYLLPFGWFRPWIYANSQLTWLDNIASGGDCGVWGVSNDGTRVVGMCQNAPVVWLEGVLTKVPEYLDQNNAQVELGQYVQAITPDGKVVAVGDSTSGVVLIRLP